MSTVTAAGVRIVRVTTLDPEQAGLAEAWHSVFTESAAAAMGDDHDAWSMDSRRAHEGARDWSHRYFAALEGDTVVGSAEIALPVLDNPQLAFIDLAVAPTRRRAGAGSALLGHLEGEARRAARTTLLAESAARPGVAELGAEFLAHHGFELGQTMQRNDLDVAAHPDDHLTQTPGYLIETSTDDTLDEWLEDRAHLQRRMSTDAPAGGLDLREEEWSAERLREQRTITARSNRRAIESVARHVDSGRLVAFTQLQVPTADPVLAYQQDTLVLREHRGHGLGVAVKAANMRALRTEIPQVRTVRTWNAEENGPMIAVNDALGYRTTGLQREWQKRLA